MREILSCKRTDKNAAGFIPSAILFYQRQEVFHPFKGDGFPSAARGRCGPFQADGRLETGCKQVAPAATPELLMVPVCCLFNNPSSRMHL